MQQRNENLVEQRLAGAGSLDPELENRLQAAGRWDDLVKLYETRAADYPDAPEVPELLARAGDLARTRLKNLVRAEELYRRALASRQQEPRALEGLGIVYESKGDLAGLAEVLEHRASASAGAAAAPLWLELGQIEERLGHPERAALAFRRAARARPMDPEPLRCAAALYVAQERYRLALDALDVLREREPAPALGAQYRAIAARLLDSPPDHALAQRALDAAVALDPSDAEARRLAEELASYEKTWRDRVRSLRRAADEERDRKTKAQLFLSAALAHLAYDRTDGLRKARELLQPVLLLWPAMPRVLDTLERLAEASGDYKALETQYEKLAVEARDRGAAVDVLVRLAMLRTIRIGDRDGALTALLRAAALDASRADAVGLALDLLIEFGRAQEAAQLLERHLETLPEGRAQVRLRLRLAELELRLSDAARARDQLESALRVDPNCVEAARQLAPLYEAAGDLQRLAEVLERTLGSLTSVDEKVEALVRIASLHGERLGRPAEALRRLARALLLAPDRAGLRPEIEKYAAAAGAWDEAVGAYRAAAQLADPATRRALLRRSAELLDAPLGRQREALELWRTLHEDDPSDPVAAQAVESLLARTGAFRELAVDYERQLAEATEPAARREILGKMIAALEQSGGEPRIAVELYRKRLELDPDDEPTLNRLAMAASALGQWETVAEVADRLARLAPDARRAREHRVRAAQVLADRLGRKEEAAEILLALLEAEPGLPAALAALERIAAAGVFARRIAEATLPAYRASGDHGRAAAALQTLVVGTGEAARRIGLMRELAALCEEKLADRRAALGWLERAFRLAPADAGLRGELERLAGELSAQAEIAALMLELAEKGGERVLAAELALRAAHLADAGGEYDLAVQALDRARALGSEKPALQALHRAAARAERWADCEKAIRSRLQLEPESTAALLPELAAVQERLGRFAEAAVSLEKVLQAAADAAPALAQLERLYEQAGDPVGLRSALERQLAAAEAAGGDRERSARLRLKLSKLLEGSDDRNEALRNYAAVLAERPNDPEALVALERMLQAPALREAAARVLAPAYEAAKESRKLVVALEAIAEGGGKVEERVAVLRKAAHVHAVDLRQPELAFGTLARALRLAPADASLRVAARRAAEECRQIETWAEVLEELSSSLGPVRETVPLLRELAEVQERKLVRRHDAIASWERVLAIDPDNLDALRALHRLHRVAEQWEPLAEVCRRLAKVIYDDQERGLLFREAATLFEATLHDREQAAASWRALAEIDPLDRDAALALERLYEALNLPADLAFALELRRAQEGSTAAGREVAFKLAELKRTALEDVAGALRIDAQILAEDPAHAGVRGALEAWAKAGGAGSRDALELLDPILARGGEHARRVAVREARLATAAAEERVGLVDEIRCLYEQELARPELAFMSLCRAFADGIERPRLLPDLERLAQASTNLEALADLFESVVEGSPTGEAFGLQLLRRAAQLRAGLGETERAVALWKDLLAEVPGDREALAALAQLHGRAQNARELAEVYRQQAAQAGEPAERAGLLLRAGQARLSLGEDAAAVELAREALAAAPKTRAAFELLAKGYDRLGRPREQAEALGELIALAPDGAARRALGLERGALLERAGEPAAAVEAYARVLAEAPGEAAAVAGLERLFGLEPTRAAAAKVLEGHYRSVDEPGRLCEVLEARAAAAAADERIALLTEVARLREGLGQRPLAFAATLRCFRERPEEASIRESLERLAAEVAAFEELGAAYEEVLERGTTPELEIELWRRLAAIRAERLARPDRAAEALEQVARRVPRDEAVLEALGALYRRTNRAHELATTLSRRAALAETTEARRELLLELARLSEEKLGDRVAAITAWTEARRLAPQDPQAFAALERLLAETGQYEALVELLGERRALLEEQRKFEEALELRIEIGQLRLQRLSDPRGALELFTGVLQQRPGHPSAVAALEQMARSDGALKAEAAMALEPVFTEAGDHLKLIQTIEARAEGAPAPERAQLLRRIAEIYAGPLSSPEMAYLYAARALEASPDDGEALAACLTLSEKAGTREELATLLGQTLERASGSESRLALQRALGRLLSAQPAEAEAASKAWQRVLDLAPGDAEALESLGLVFERRGAWGELVEVLRRQLAAAEADADRARLLQRIGQIQDEQLNDPSGAIATLRRLLELTPEDTAALARLDRLCLSAERWAELADALAAQIAIATRTGDAGERIKLQTRLAALREQRLLDRSGAVALYREILAAEPSHPEAVARLEAIVTREPGFDEAADALADAYRATHAHVKLAQLLEERASSSTDAGARKRLLSELARIRSQHLDRTDLAFLALCKAFREEPNDAELRRALERAADQSESFEELAALYEEELPNLSGLDAAEVCLKLAQLHETRLKDDEQALLFYERARSYDPACSGKVLPALDRLYKETEEWGKLAEVLAASVQLSEDPAERLALLFRLGQLASEKLDPPAPERAIRAFEQILEIDKGHLPAARSLERLYEDAERWDKLAEVFELERAKAQGAERERLTARLADVYGNKLNDKPKAIALYGEVLALNPRSEPAFVALEALHEAQGELEPLAELIRRRLAATVDPREITRLSEKLGRSLAALGRRDEAIAAFKAALERDPRHRKALEALRDIHEEAGAHEELAAVLRRLIPLQDDAAAVKRVRLRLAEVLAGVGRRDEALDAARRVLDVEPHQIDELERAEKLFLSLNSQNDQIRAMEVRAQVARDAGDAAGAAAILRSIADLYTNTLNKREAAAPYFERILEVAPTERTAYDALREIYAAQNDWRRWAAAVERFLPAVQERTERVAILSELAAVQEAQLGHKDLAFLSLSRAFSEAPEDEAVRTSLARLADETGSREELVTIYEDVADTAEKGPLAVQLYLELARIQDEWLDSPSDAEGTLRKILDFDPANRTALEALSGMFARRGRDSEYVLSLEQKLDAAATIEERKAIFSEIAFTCETRLNKPEEAAAAWQRSLELEPDRATLRALADLFGRQKKYESMVETLLRARDFETDPTLRSRVQYEIAEIYEREMQDDEAAVAAFQLAVEQDPTNREALAALERLYTKLDRPRELLGVYDAQLKVVDDRDRVSILFKAAGIWEDKLQNLENADACLEAVLALEPTNLQAVKGLERLRRADAEQHQSTARWEDLLRAYEHHLALQPELSEQVSLMVAMAEILYKELKKVDRAAQLYQGALELYPRSREAMHGLGLLYERSGNWPFALEMLQREAEDLGTSREAVELHHRIGKINQEMLLDIASAKQAYERALAVDEGYLPSLRALKEIYGQEKDWDRFLQVLVREAEHTVDVEERANAFLEVARFYYESREDRDSAARYYEESLTLVPDREEAARPLADIYVAREEWEKAEQMLDIVTRHLAEDAARDPKGGSELCRQLYRLGYVCEKLKKTERAIGSYERAYQLDSTYLLAAEGYANLLVATERPAEALSVYQAILIHHREALTDLEVVEYYFQVGDIYRKLGQPERARKEFEKALAIDANHDPSLRAMVELCEQLSDFEGAIEHRLRLVPLLDDDAERLQTLLAVGRIAREKLSDPYRAIDAYSDAVRINPDSPEVLEGLLGLYRETRQSQRAIETLERLLALPGGASDPTRTKKHWYALGEVRRDELKDIPKAVEAFNRALDLDYKFLQAFAAIESLLASNKQWALLEENYHRMIQRLPKTPETHVARMTIFKTLGDFYEKVKKDRRASKQVYQVVMKGLPDDVAVLEKYASLASEEEGSEAEAIDAWRRALPTSGNPQNVVKQLLRLFARSRDYDSAFIAAQVSAQLLGETGAEEAEILKKLAPYAKKREQATRPLTNNLWVTQLYHPKVRGPMGELLGLVADTLGPALARKHNAYGVDPKSHRIDLESSLELAITSYKYVLQILDMEALDLYSPFLVSTRERLKHKGSAQAAPPPDRELFLEVMHTHPIALKAGGKLFSQHSQRELHFFMGRALAFSRPELVLAKVLGAERLEALLQAATLAGVPSFRVTADPRAVDAELKLFEKLDPQYRGALARLARDYAKVAATNDVLEFIEGAELTANRVGMLLCGDVEVAKHALAQEPGAKVPLRARTRDLMLFCLSREHAELRSAIGLKIEVKTGGAAR